MGDKSFNRLAGQGQAPREIPAKGHRGATHALTAPLGPRQFHRPALAPVAQRLRDLADLRLHPLQRLAGLRHLPLRQALRARQQLRQPGRRPMAVS